MDNNGHDEILLIDFEAIVGGSWCACDLNAAVAHASWRTIASRSRVACEFDVVQVGEPVRFKRCGDVDPRLQSACELRNGTRPPRIDPSTFQRPQH